MFIRPMLASGVTIDVNTLLLMHLDGANGSTTFTEEKGRTVSGNGGIALSTAQFKFGTASVLGASGKYLSIAAGGAPDLDFGTNNFTFEGWIYPTSYNTRNWVFSSGHQSYVSGCFAFGFTGNGSVDAACYQVNSGGDYITGAAGDVPLNTWSHYAAVRNGTNISIYINGVLKGSATIAAGTLFNFNASVGSRFLGGNWDGTVGNPIGYFDETRISSIARYTSAFTPPTAPFTS